MAGIKEKLDEIKAVEDTLTLNKVARFAYTDEAYETNDANGVSDYDVNRQQNIPVANADILKVNETILSKGYRTQASSITRMLMNHFLGRISYNLNKLNDNMSNLLSGLSDSLGKPEGIATLDAEGRIPYSQLPESAMEYKGTWDASTNTPSLADGTGNTGDFYFVSVAGTHNFGSGDISFLEGDRVLYDGTTWQKLSGGSVRSVNNSTPDSTGNINLTSFDLLSVRELNIEEILKINGISIEQIINKKIDPFLMSGWDSSEKCLGNGAYTVAIAHGNGRWVAVGGAQADSSVSLRYRTDTNKLWQRPSDRVLVGVVLKTVAFGEGRWIVMDRSLGWYSDDNAETWNSIGSVGFGEGSYSGEVACLAYGNGRWVAVGYNQTGSTSPSYAGIAYSKDNGVTWNSVGSIMSGSSRLWSVAYGNSRWVAVGDYSSYGVCAYYSDDNAETWQPISNLNIGTDSLMSVAYGDGIWVAVGSNWKVYYSEDNAVTWKAVDKLFDNSVNFNSVVFANGRWIAVGNKGFGMYSHDAKVWYAIPYSYFNFDNSSSAYVHKGVAYGNNKLTVIGEYSYPFNSEYSL